MTRPVLSHPSKNEAVKELQDVLNRIGSLLDMDEDFGSAMALAVREAQAPFSRSDLLGRLRFPLKHEGYSQVPQLECVTARRKVKLVAQGHLGHDLG